MSLPILQSPYSEMTMLQTRWKAELDPLLKNPALEGIILPAVSLSSGVNVVNHRLGRKQQGWMVTDRNGVATIYKSAPFNALTLVLTVSAPVIVDLYVF